MANDEVDSKRMDEAIDAYVDWREEAAHVWAAYARWESAGDGDASAAFSAYRAALDREEHGSRVYAALLAPIEAPSREQEPGVPNRRLLPW